MVNRGERGEIERRRERCEERERDYGADQRIMSITTMPLLNQNECNGIARLVHGTGRPMGITWDSSRGIIFQYPFFYYRRIRNCPTISFLAKYLGQQIFDGWQILVVDLELSSYACLISVKPLS